MREEERKGEEHHVNRIKDYPKVFHDFNTDKMNVKEQLFRLGPDDDREMLEKREEICEVLNDKFQSVFRNEDTEFAEVDGNPSGYGLDKILVVERGYC